MDNNSLTLEEFLNPASTPPPTEEPIEPALDPAPQDPPATNVDGSDDEEVQIRRAYFDYLVENGVIEIDEDYQYDGSPTEFKKLVDSSKEAKEEKVLQKVWASLSPDFRNAFEYALSTGSSLQEYLEALSPKDYANVDLNSEDAQRAIIHQWYKQTTPHSDSRIAKMIDRLADDGDLQSEAAEALQELQEMEQARLSQLKEREEQARIAQQAAQELHTKQLVDAINTSSFIHPARREKVRTFFFNPIAKGNQTTTAFNETIQNILSNPEHQAQLADILLDYSATNGFTLERLEKRVKSKATSDFKASLDKAVDPISKQGAPARVTKTNTSDFLQEWLSH